MGNVSLVRYLKSHNVKVNTMNQINQDYAWGLDSRRLFKDIMLALSAAIMSCCVCPTAADHA